MGPLEDPPLYSANCQKERREDGTRTRIKSLAHFPFEQDFLNSTLAGATYRLARLFHARGTASNCCFIAPCIHLTMENQGQLIPTTRLEKDFLCIRRKRECVSLRASQVFPRVVALGSRAVVFHYRDGTSGHLVRLHAFN